MNDENTREEYTLGYGTVTDYISQRTASSEAAFFLPQLKPGMNLLDCGCGPGTITLGLAETVTPGSVNAIDVEESQVIRAQDLFIEKGMPNIEAQTASVYELPFPDETFDAVFAHALLHHLSQPIEALKEMRRVLIKGGVIGIRAEDRGADILNPSNELIERGHQLFMRVWQHNGGDPFWPRKQKASLREAGFSQIEESASTLVRSTPEATTIFGNFVSGQFSDPRISGVALEQGWAEQSTLNDISIAFEEWGRHPDAFQVETWCEALAWK